MSAPRPFGWLCELVHDASGTVVNTVFIRFGECEPLQGPEGKPAGWTWRATPLFTAPAAPFKATAYADSAVKKAVDATYDQDHTP